VALGEKMVTFEWAGLPETTVDHNGRPQLGKIVILSKDRALEFEYDKPWACISITDNLHFAAELNHGLSKQNRVDLLSLTFHDIWEARHAQYGTEEWIMMKEEQADQVVSFVKAVWDKIDLLMVHCYAGISRSSAIGKILSEHYSDGFSNFYHKLYQPNPHVYNLVKESLKK